jgi:hypothetical protein
MRWIRPAQPRKSERTKAHQYGRTSLTVYQKDTCPMTQLSILLVGYCWIEWKTRNSSRCCRAKWQMLRECFLLTSRLAREEESSRCVHDAARKNKATKTTILVATTTTCDNWAKRFARETAISRHSRSFLTRTVVRPGTQFFFCLWPIDYDMLASAS